MKKPCSVKGCKNEVNEAWIDVADPETDCHGRFPFCDKHFDKIMPYIKKKEKEEQEADKSGYTWFWCYAPLRIVNEALNQ